MMPAFLTLVMLVPPLPHGGGPLRSYREIRDDIRATLRAEATANSSDRRCEAIVRLTEIYRELASDPRQRDSETLQKHKIRLRSRLLSVQREIDRSSSSRQRVGGRGQSANPRGGGAVMPDHGPLLVALIERTISPDFWDVHGGPGTVFYYRPLRVLVVRATDDVHGQVGGVLTGLRE